MITDETLADLEARARAATPGPWWCDAITVQTESVVSIESSHVTIADCSPGLGDVPLMKVTANADFIAAANPATMLELVAEVKALRTNLGRVLNEPFTYVAPAGHEVNCGWHREMGRITKWWKANDRNP